MRRLQNKGRDKQWKILWMNRSWNGIMSLGVGRHLVTNKIELIKLNFGNL